MVENERKFAKRPCNGGVTDDTNGLRKQVYTLDPADTQKGANETTNCDFCNSFNCLHNKNIGNSYCAAPMLYTQLRDTTSLTYYPGLAELPMGAHKHYKE